MAIVVSVVPEEDSPFITLPWVVTFKPADDEDDWDPVTCGPYQREHAEALAEAVALELDDDVLAVVEPLLPALNAESILDAIEQNRELAAAAADLAEDDETDLTAEDDVEEDPEENLEDADEEEEIEFEVPTAAEIRTGIENVSRELVAALDEVVNAE